MTSQRRHRPRVWPGVLSAALIAGLLGVTVPSAAFAEQEVEVGAESIEALTPTGTEGPATPGVVAEEAGQSAAREAGAEQGDTSAPAIPETKITSSSFSVTRVSGKVEVDPGAGASVNVYSSGGSDTQCSGGAAPAEGGSYSLELFDFSAGEARACSQTNTFSASYSASASTTALAPFGYAPSYWAGEGKPSATRAKDEVPLVVEPGTERKNVDFTLNPNGLVSGLVKVSLEGPKNESPSIFEVVTVPANESAFVDGGVQRDVSSAPIEPDGSYAVATPAGEYKVLLARVDFGSDGATAHALGFYSETTGVTQAEVQATVVKVAAKATLPNINFEVRTPGEQRVIPGSVDISGTAEVGKQLRATTAGWTPREATLSYQWHRNQQPIAGATSDTYVLTATDANTVVSVTVTGTLSGFESASKASAGTAPVVDPSPASLRVSVFGEDGKTPAKAWVTIYAAGSGLPYFTGNTSDAGEVTLESVPRGNYDVVAYGTGADRGMVSSTAKLTEPGQEAHLDLSLVIARVPADVALPDGIPGWGGVSLDPGSAHEITVGGEPGGSARITVTPGSRTIDLVEKPAGSGNYVGTIPANVATPGADGLITLSAVVTGASGVPGNPITFDLVYIDPSGNVVDRFGTPLAAADVVLKRSESETGDFAEVADGDESVMDPSINTKNPDKTNAEGFFRWDVVPGWYKVLASKDGVSIETAAMPVPPEQLNLLLAIDTGVQPEPSLAPSVTGKPEVGQRLTALAGEWPEAAGERAPIEVQSYQWIRNGEAIPGATQSTYTVTAADAGAQLSVGLTVGRVLTPDAGTVVSWVLPLDAGKVAASTGGTGGETNGGKGSETGSVTVGEQPAGKGSAKSVAAGGSESLAAGALGALVLLLAGAGVLGARQLNLRQCKRVEK